MNTAFNSDTRSVEVQLHIYFEEEPLIIDSDNYLINMSLLEELASDDQNPFGALSANELSFTLYNPEDIFTPTNSDSPYASKIETSMKVKVFIREEMQETDWIPMGTFYVNNWSCSQGTGTVDVICYDDMYRIMYLPAPKMEVKENTTVYDFFRELLIRSGIPSARISLDPTLKQQALSFAYPLAGTLGETLRDLATSQLCYVYVTRDEKVRVQSVYTTVTTNEVWTDDNQIYSSTVNRELLAEYSGVEVIYKNKTLSDTTEVISLQDYEVPPGTVELPTLLVKENPLRVTDYIHCSSPNIITFPQIRHTPWEVNLTTTNKERQGTLANIMLFGKQIDTSAEVKLTATDDSLVARIGYKNYAIAGEYLDSKEQAEKLLGLMHQYISTPTPKLELEARGNPYLSVGNIIQVQDSANKISMSTLLLRQQFTYDSALQVTVTGLNATVLGGIVR